MSLTRRQEQFVRMMMTLQEEFNGPVRYAVLAERLGVSPLTAYDMLCLLEEKGYVTSAYQLPSDKTGPGPAERVFFPGPMAGAHGQRMRVETGGRHLEGEALRQYVLDRMGRGDIAEDDKALVAQLMARLPATGHGDVRYCEEVMTVAALRLQHTPGQRVLLEHLPNLLPAQASACQANLCLLGGFVFGILAQQDASSHEWLARLREHLPAYLAAVMQMSPLDCQKLAGRLAGVFAALGEVR